MHINTLSQSATHHHQPQHISTSTYQSHQHSKNPTHHYLNIPIESATHQYSNISTHQYLKISKHQYNQPYININITTHQHINTSIQQHNQQYINTNRHINMYTSTGPKMLGFDVHVDALCFVMCRSIKN